MKRIVLGTMLVGMLTLSMAPTAMARDRRSNYYKGVEIHFGKGHARVQFRHVNDCSCLQCRPAPVCDVPAPPIVVRPGYHGHHEHAPQKIWIDGHFDTQMIEVAVPGYYKDVYVPPVYQWKWDHHCRAYVQVCVREGYYRQEWVPPCTEYRQQQVWVPGHFEYR